VDPELSSHNDFWRASAAPLAAALIAMGAGGAHALSMGKVQLQSALGQSLVAEIDLADISDEDAKSLKPTLAAPSAFAGMGLEFNPALNGTQITLQRRASGSWYLKMANSRPLNEPFVDIVVELNWASGRIVRTYTMLLDPPKSQEAASPSPQPAPAPETQAHSAPPALPASAPVPQAANPTPVPATSTQSAKPADTTARVVSPSSGSGSERKTVRVRSGDTAGKIAYSLAPAGVSVEQMLVALLNTNPSAFTSGNVNWLLANSELLVPDEAVAKKMPQAEARQLIAGQNQEFQSMRRGLASTAATAPAPKTSTSPTPAPKADAASAVAKPTPPSAPKPLPGDSLKLSKGSVEEKANMEQLAQQRAKTEATERAKELAKNIEELNQLAKVASKPEVASAPAAPATAAASAPKAAESAAPTNPASTPVNGPGPKVASNPPIAPAPTSGDLLEVATQNPAVSGLVLGLLGLLLGMGWRRRKQSQHAGSGSNAGKEPWGSTANTSFEKGGGARVDTTEVGTATLNSTLFQDSQLEIAQELDPVAEAEVYLAYGKDVPAEEILKEGLQQDPTRVAIHLKLLGIFAKRGDADSFESMAQNVKTLVHGSGPDWSQVQEMGRSLWPSNPLYAAPGLAPTQAGEPSAADAHPSVLNLDAEAMEALSEGTAPAPKASTPAQANSQASDELSLDLTPLHHESPRAPASAAVSTDRLGATLALAEQFLEIGEKEGARALLEEVIAGESDLLRERAKALLTKAG